MLRQVVSGLADVMVGGICTIGRRTLFFFFVYDILENVSHDVLVAVNITGTIRLSWRRRSCRFCCFSNSGVAFLNFGYTSFAVDT